MAISGIDFYTFASTLFENSKDGEEAALRSVVSRAYYGAFLEGRDKAGINTKTGTVHQDTISHYKNSGSAAVGNRLEDLRLKRNKADYDLALNFNRREAGEALIYAKRILTDLKITIPAPPAAQSEKE